MAHECERTRDREPDRKDDNECRLDVTNFDQEYDLLKVNFSRTRSLCLESDYVAFYHPLAAASLHQIQERSRKYLKLHVMTVQVAQLVCRLQNWLESHKLPWYCHLRTRLLIDSSSGRTSLSTRLGLYLESGWSIAAWGCDIDGPQKDLKTLYYMQSQNYDKVSLGYTWYWPSLDRKWRVHSAAGRCHGSGKLLVYHHLYALPPDQVLINVC